MARFSPSIRALAAPLAILLLTGPSASAGPFSLATIATSGDTFDPSGFGAPVLNNAGAVAFNATLAEPDLRAGIFRVTGGSLTTIALEDGFSRFGDVSINGQGQVGFEASTRSPRCEGIFRGDGGPTARIVGTRDAGDFDFVNAGPSINAGGRVAFIGETEVTFIAGVYAGVGGVVTPIYDENGALEGFIGNPSLNDSGAVAFNATLDSGVSGLFVGNGGGTFTTVVDDSGAFVSAFAFGDPSLNERGDVAFRAGTNAADPSDNSGATSEGIFLFRNGVLAPVLQGGFDAFAGFGDPSLNELGQVAFLVSPTFDEEVLLIGPDLVSDRVIGTGDVLLGRTIIDLSFSREGLNDRGQLAFTASFDDGSSGIFLASPVAVPEPSSLVLAAIGGFVVLICCRRLVPPRLAVPAGAGPARATRLWIPPRGDA